MRETYSELLNKLVSYAFISLVLKVQSALVVHQYVNYLLELRCLQQAETKEPWNLVLIIATEIENKMEK